MCGIVGKYYFDKRSFHLEDLSKMMEAIHHRGPDASGFFHDGRVALGFQRLSIIDTVTGNQPLYSENNSIVLLANGEIYNYKELTNVLKAKGHQFRTKSDCEVIVHMYEEYGSSFVEKLNGMFAFSLYDKGKELLMIARDRIGIKPLYYYKTSDTIHFSSEIKGILASDEVKIEENEDVLGEYLCFRYLSNNRTFFKGIKALNPGTFIEITKDQCRIVEYWRHSFDKQDYAQVDPEKELDNILCSSVQRQMMTDVPLGTQLSGGVDSSLVSAIASKYSPGLKTFSVGFYEKEFDETSYAKLLAKKLGLEYHEIKVDNCHFANSLPQVIWYHDEPLCHANSVQMYLLCKYAREFVKVLLTGEGADELFAGYPRYFICKLGESFLNLNKNIANVILFGLKCLPTRKIKKLTNNLGLDLHQLILWNSCFTDKVKVAWLFDKDNVDITSRKELLESIWNENYSCIDNLLIYEQKTYLQPILMRQDKMSMAASIESRVPILDNEVIEYANNIPTQFKMRNFETKYIFKSVATKHIPSEIVYKKKVGFGVPIGKWLKDKNGLGRFLDMLLDVPLVGSQINQIKLEQIIKEHRSELMNHEDILWPLINYTIWKEKFIL